MNPPILTMALTGFGSIFPAKQRFSGWCRPVLLSNRRVVAAIRLITGVGRLRFGRLEDRTLWEVNMYYPQPANAGQLFAAEYGKVGLRDGLFEEASTHERTQRGIASGAITHFQFQDEEFACRHGHEAVMAWVGQWRADSSATAS